jgi:hypothetical protein
MHFAPLPADDEALRKLQELWLPFVTSLSKATGEPLSDLIDLVLSTRVQIGLVWNDEEKKAYALAGWTLLRVGPDLIGTIRWLEGFEHERWKHLLPELEQFLTEHLKCTVIRAEARPGWTRDLKRAGYKTTHHVMEKRI